MIDSLLRVRSYYCTKCRRIHSVKSQIGKKHMDFNLKKQKQLNLGDDDL